jgi:AcrR family transcriptional regulator
MNVRSDNPATEVRRGRGRPLVDDKRRKLLDAALKLFAARGYHGTNVPEVAQAAGVGTGSLYRYFAHKEALVNEVYRDAKLRLRAALLDGAAAPAHIADAEHWFRELWKRLAAFADAEPDAFRFLEMQDHVEYLDRESRQLEMSVLAPLWLAGQQLRASHRAATGVSVDVLIALLWGAFVGLVKANRLGYLPLDGVRLDEACTACWRMIAPAIGPRDRTADDARAARPSTPSADARAERSASTSKSSKRAPKRTSSSHARRPKGSP